MSELSSEFLKTTILFPVTESGVILGEKKQGFGAGWWNGFGGKVETGETYEEAAIRETEEESGLVVNSLVHAANVLFYFDYVPRVMSRAYISTDFSGVPIETDEMRPQAFPLDQLPYDSMWPADRFWVPRVLSTDELLGFRVFFDKDKKFLQYGEIDPLLLSGL